MATLAFSTVGTLLGGPIGGAIGALIGQSIDQELLAPRGPKLGELTVQTSSYGTQIPRIYGRMRVAGSVIWSTDMVESEQMAGAKGQSGAVTSYAVSFAVALSSRPVAGIGRIWADGKLIRGQDGQFKVSTEFRLHSGDEGQEADPLIASIEGIDTCPAYRGLALAVFENLELAEFGNRIPFLTFEMLGEENDAPVPVDAILADASRGAIRTSVAREVTGYAAYGANIRAALSPLVDTFAIPLFDDGDALRGAEGKDAAVLSMEELGNGVDDERHPRTCREFAPAGTLASCLRFAFYDEARDFQSGEVRAVAGEGGGPEVRRECPAAIHADQAKSLVQEALAREWVERDRLTLRLPPRLLGIEPGSEVEVPLSPARWMVSRVAVEAFVPVVELRPSWSRSSSALAASSGRVLASPDVAVTAVTVALLEVPEPAADGASLEPTRLLAASSASPGWKRRIATVEAGNTPIGVALPARKSVLGTALTQLSSAQDDADTVDVQLIDHEQWLENRDSQALAEGANLAMIGREVIQFGDAVALGAGRFRLGRLERGRGATTWAMAEHVAGEPFVLLEPAGLSKIELPPWLRGLPLRVRAAPESFPPIGRHPWQLGE